MLREYESLLYRLHKPQMFRDTRGAHFLGRITGVTAEGLLCVERENGSATSYRHKEIAYL